MSLIRSRLPEVGDLVLATVQEVFEQGAYVALDEYGVRGYVPRVEVRTTWVKHIRDYLKERQKVVLKVIRVNPEKGHVDLSLRRVTDQEKQKKVISWKQFQRAQKLLEIIGTDLKISKELAISEVGIKLEETYGSVFLGLEETAKFGKEAASKAKIDENYADAVFKVAREHIKIPLVKVKGKLKVSCRESKGVEVIKDTLTKLKQSTPSGVTMDIFTVGAPYYRVEAQAYDYKAAEEALEALPRQASLLLKNIDGEIEFKREKS